MFVNLSQPKGFMELISIEKSLLEVVQSEWDEMKVIGITHSQQTQKDVSLAVTVVQRLSHLPFMSANQRLHSLRQYFALCRYEKCKSTLCRKSWGFAAIFGLLQQEMLPWLGRVNVVGDNLGSNSAVQIKQCRKTYNT